MAGDGRIDGKMVIQRGQGISQAIRDELGLTQEQCNKLGKSVWTKIFEQVEAQNQQGKIYDGGSDAFGKTSENFVVHKGQIIEFSENIWNNIVKLVNDKLSTNITTEKPSTTSETQEETTSAQTSSTTVKAEDIKVTVKPMYMPECAKEIIEGQKEGIAIREEIKQGNLQNLNSFNVSTAVAGLTFKDNQRGRESAKIVFEKLIERMHDTGLIKYGAEKNWEEVAQLSMNEINKLIQEYRKRIYDMEIQEVKNAAEEKKYHNSNIKEIQQTFDEANEFLVEVANMSEKPKIKTRQNGCKTCTLPDGREINVNYYKGEISSISICPNTGMTEFSIEYNAYWAHYNTKESNNKWEGGIGSGYDFDKIKAIVEKIFGN